MSSTRLRPSRRHLRQRQPHGAHRPGHHRRARRLQHPHHRRPQLRLRRLPARPTPATPSHHDHDGHGDAAPRPPHPPRSPRRRRRHAALHAADDGLHHQHRPAAPRARQRPRPAHAHRRSWTSPRSPSAGSSARSPSPPCSSPHPRSTPPPGEPRATAHQHEHPGRARNPRRLRLSFVATIAPLLQQPGLASDVYFEAVIFILAFLLAGRWLEARARPEPPAPSAASPNSNPPTPPPHPTLKPGPQVPPLGPGIDHHHRLQHLPETLLPLSAIEPNDLVRVLPGDRIPLDSLILHGRSSIDESMLTGEPLPVTRPIGDKSPAAPSTSTAP